MFQNSKFDKLVIDVFSKIDGNELEQQLNQLYDKTHYITNKASYSGKYTDSRLYRDFCNGNELKVFRKNFPKLEKKSEITSIKHVVNKNIITIRNPTISRLPISHPPIIPEVNKQEVNHEQKVVRSESVVESISGNKIMNDIQSLDKNIFIDIIRKCDDYYSNAFFGYVSKIFNIANNEQKIQMLKTIKLDIITKFNKENYYKDYDYSLKHFKKSFADETFTSNEPITKNMLKIYGDIFNVNIVYLDNSSTEYITKFNKKNATFIFNDNGNTIESLMTIKNFIRGDICSNILGIDKIFKEDELSKLKLDQLQNIAKMRNLNIKKPGKTGKINIKKEELINIICNI